ncbi:MAG: HAD family hydrolase [Bacteroidota bacterium]
MILVFDLDDTLYEELTFVKSGFRAVAYYLNEQYSIPVQNGLDFMLRKLSSGRGRIFDDLLIHHGIFKKNLVRKCVSTYRLHQPEIKLYPEADACLERFRHYPLYIVTDGNKVVQNNKIKALGLDKRVKYCYITHRYGIKNAKPSPYCFVKICEREKVNPKEVVYIADNPHKDFVGIKPLGFKTIRVLQGQYRKLVLGNDYEAAHQISSLGELDEDQLNHI